jgi:Domain of unknown function (DUF5658)
MRRRLLRFETEVSWFVLACVLDVAVTFLSLRYSAVGQTRSTLVESNPVARWFLNHWGFAGMAAFKGAMTMLVVVIAEVVGRTRPLVARLLLTGGTMVVAAVVVYSARLLWLHR